MKQSNLLQQQKYIEQQIQQQESRCLELIKNQKYDNILEQLEFFDTKLPISFLNNFQFKNLNENESNIFHFLMSNSQLSKAEATEFSPFVNTKEANELWKKRIRYNLTEKMHDINFIDKILSPYIKKNELIPEEYTVYLKKTNFAFFSYLAYAYKINSQSENEMIFNHFCKNFDNLYKNIDNKIYQTSFLKLSNEDLQKIIKSWFKEKKDISKIHYLVNAIKKSPNEFIKQSLLEKKSIFGGYGWKNEDSYFLSTDIITSSFSSLDHFNFLITSFINEPKYLQQIIQKTNSIKDHVKIQNLIYILQNNKLFLNECENYIKLAKLPNLEKIILKTKLVQKIEDIEISNTKIKPTKI